MKISEMTNDQACEAMIRIAQPVANLMEDENVIKLIEDASKTEESVAGISSLIPKVVAIAIKDHRKDLYEIIGGLTFTKTEKVSGMNFLATIKELRESIDEDFIGFFTLSKKQTNAITEE